MDTVHFERYEYKYFVPEDRAEAIRRFIHPYTAPDPYADRAPDRRYTIYNLYFDTPTLDFYTACVNTEIDRFKLRIRWYDDGGKGPFFFEVKRKIRHVIVKDRARVSGDAFELVLRGGLVRLPDGVVRDTLAGFLDRTVYTGARPVVLTRYTREPYESVFGDYARITLDRAMCFQPASGYDLAGDPRGWTYVDGAAQTEGVLNALVLELKFTRDFPRWMSDLVAEFDLERIGYSKYVSAIFSRLESSRGGMDIHRRATFKG